MRVGFVVSKEIKEHEGERTLRYDYAFDWKGITKLAIKNKVSPPSENWYQFLRALCLNAEFVRSVKAARKRCGLKEEAFGNIPEADRFSQGRYWLITHIDGEPVERIAINKTRVSTIDKEAKKLEEEYFLSYSRNINLKGLIEYGVFEVIPPTRTIRFENIDGELHIVVSRKVSRNSIKKAIDKHFKELKRQSKEVVDDTPPIKISERDFEIVRLRDVEKLPFPDIATIIPRKFPKDDPNCTVNDDSVRIAYHRAKKNISSLFRKK